MSDWESFELEEDDGPARDESISSNSVQENTGEDLVTTVASGASWGAVISIPAVRHGAHHGEVGHGDIVGDGENDARQGGRESEEHAVLLASLRRLAGEDAEEDQRSNPRRPALTACEARLSDSIVSLRSSLLASAGPSAATSPAASRSPEKSQVVPPRCSLSLSCVAVPGWGVGRYQPGQERQRTTDPPVLLPPRAVALAEACCGAQGLSQEPETVRAGWLKKKVSERGIMTRCA